MDVHNLDLDDIQSRLRFDYQIVSLMSSPLMRVEAYRNVDDLRARREAVTSVSDGHLATHYRVEYNIRTLVNRGRYSDQTTVHFDLFANNNYPHTEPSCFVVDSEMPWSPHFWKGYPVCIGNIWEQADGSMLLGQLLIHIAKLVNFDEPAHTPGYEGYNGEAIEYWETVLGRRPITANLRYPKLPDLVHEPKESEPRSSLFVRKRVVGAPERLIRRRTIGSDASQIPRIRIKRTT